MPLAVAQISSVVASPVLPGPQFGHKVRLSRRGMRQKPPVDDTGNIRIFDAAPVQLEIKGIFVKYEQAASFLNGIGLVPQRDMSDYVPISAHSTKDTPVIIIDSDSPDNITTSSVDPWNITLSAEDILPPSDHAPSVPLLPGPERGTVMPMKDYMWGALDVLYYGSMKVGSPSQYFTVDIDTGSADTWIPLSTDCPQCQPNTRQFFDPSASKTFNDTGSDVTISYGTGTVSGDICTDTFLVGQDLSVPDQCFVAVTDESDDFESGPNDGLMGLAFGTIAQTKKPTVFENMLDHRRVSAPLFSVHLERNKADGSEVCFGCYDISKTMGSITWIPVESKTYWCLTLDAITVNTDMTVLTDTIAAIDTGTTLIYVPNGLAAKFYAMISGARPAAEYGPEFFTYPCNSNIDIAFTFGTVHFKLNLFDFNLGRTSANSPDCVGGILALGNDFPSNLAIIGDEFLKSWYTTFDYSNGARVGFSPSINNKPR
ncbi:acid protease [Fistulina hepatica ATCC 64428]|uniref:Acid protease n=1 Tax=Fistulina hepatica ATCC 64428 TaxID=1128425 RepID=A0A0D7A016_9AGAR|nr:acid protease [Fistulina hepatica ATCC 64428]